MEFIEVNKERLRFAASRGFTSILVTFFIALPLLFVVSMMSRSSYFDLSSIHGVEGRNSTSTNFLDSSNESSQPSSIPKDKTVIDSLTDRFHDKSGSKYEPSQQPGKLDEQLLDGTTLDPGTEKATEHERIVPTSIHNEDPPLETPGPTNGEKSFSKDSSFRSTGISHSTSLDGLIPPKFDKSSCKSRYKSILYRKISPYKPSPFLLAKLRKYEKLHALCGPHTESYNKTLNVLSQNRVNKPVLCKYIILRPVNGLGNRMISLAASFLYALLTNRVFLVYNENDMANLFCEPFPNSSWLLPIEFPLKKLIRRSSEGTGAISSCRHITLQKRESRDKRDFFCDQGQNRLREIPWLVILSEQYFAPLFFIMPIFKKEVTRLFPEKETVFHHLGRYLFNPSNHVWDHLIAKFYDAYLAKVDQRVGLQIRVFHPNTKIIQITMDQLLACNSKAKFIPKIPSTKKAAILVTSLYPDFYKNLSSTYKGKKVISVYQPSHEGYQHKGDNVHNMKAWAEIYLLSLCDVLVTSSWSTFGYVAQGLGGLEPWILHRHGKGSYEPCKRAESIEPCFHYPSGYDCKTERKIDMGAIVPFLSKCEDRESGVKLFSRR